MNEVLVLMKKGELIMGGYLLLGIVLAYVFYKIFSFLDSINGFDRDGFGSDNFSRDNSGSDDEVREFITMRDAFSIARGENPMDPKAQWKSITDPLGLHDKK